MIRLRMVGSLVAAWPARVVLASSPNDTSRTFSEFAGSDRSGITRSQQQLTAQYVHYGQAVKAWLASRIERAARRE